MDKAVNDNGVLEIKVENAKEVLPHYASEITTHPVNLFESIGAAEHAMEAMFASVTRLWFQGRWSSSTTTPGRTGTT